MPDYVMIGLLIADIALLAWLIRIVATGTDPVKEILDLISRIIR